jgi:CRP/FNR family cyclic AMP-dependent transcriptional regulator
MQALPDPRSELLLNRLPETLRPLASRGKIRRFRKGTVIIHEGTRGDEVYFLLQGRVRAFSTDANEREVSFAIDSVGEYFGEMALDGGPRSASVEALETTVCAVVTRQTVWEHVGHDPGFARALIERLIARTRWTTARARELALYDVYGRLRRQLESLAGPAGADGERAITERITHQALASRLGSSREMVSRLLKDLERGGYIRTARASVTLLKALPDRW